MEPVVVSIHELPERTRLRVRAEPLPMLAERAERLADALAVEPGVTKVEINRRTGSVLVSHAATVTATALSARAREALAAFRAHDADVDDEGPAITGIARELHKLFVDANRDLRRRTNGMLDLGTAATLTLLSVGAIEIAVTQTVPVPPWFNLAWWSFRTFMTTIESRAAAAASAPAGKGTVP